MRIAYRFLFTNAELEDDRSDNDENESEEEQKLDELKVESVDALTGQEIIANGHSKNGTTSGADILEVTTNRKKIKTKA